ncbi:hypothetical protein KBZ21_40885, partial [Streptomyces sp. A73]|nr:hypothetical protein [Streptomyces sp. A73]
ARGRILGVAYNVMDVLDMLEAVGLERADVRLDDADLIDWRGGGQRGGEVGVVHQLGVDHPLGLAGHAAASALVRPAETASS